MESSIFDESYRKKQEESGGKAILEKLMTEDVQNR